jgi:hypothetical protein
MTDRPCLVTNFAYGTGPYLRITELAVSVNDHLERLGHPRHRIVLPLIYGSKQRRIMREEFGSEMDDRPEEFVFDERLGELFAETFYGDESYRSYLQRWVSRFDEWSERISEYLDDEYGDAVRFELSRAPRVSLDVSPSYYTSFGYLSKIFSKEIEASNSALPEELLSAARQRAVETEQEHDLQFISEPGTFTHCPDRTPTYPTEELVAPLMEPPEPPETEPNRGIYVTVSGIPGLEELYQEARSLDYNVYTNDPEALGGGTKALPSVLGSDAIEFHVARAGWGSVWLSLFTETPLLMPAWQPSDDPEIRYNVEAIEAVGIGSTFNEHQSKVLPDYGNRIRSNMRELKDQLRAEYRTLNGIDLAARKIATDLDERMGSTQ